MPPMQQQAGSSQTVNSDTSQAPVAAPTLSLPKGGGAIRGIGEKFGANPVTGTGSMTVPIAASPGRSGFGPQLSLSYDSGAGNGSFGFGWNLSLPAITRKTDKGLPQYRDNEESDVYLLSGAEDLVPEFKKDATGKWIIKDGKHVILDEPRTIDGVTYRVRHYRPRIESLFARIECWTNVQTDEIHWRSITRDNITTLYGKDNTSRIFDPTDRDPKHPTRIFSWLICESYDDKGNAIFYEYKKENTDGIDLSQAHEQNRTTASRSANSYLKSIKYGNRVSRLSPDFSQNEWMFEVVFDYNEEHYAALPLDPVQPEADQHQFVRASASPGHSWAVRPDPFSFYRAGFEVRTYRRCRRVLMFHHFAELGSDPYLVRSTEFEYTDLDYSQSTTVEAELAHQGSTRFASFIRAVTQSGFVRDDTQAVFERNGVTYVTYLKKSLPPLEFEYSRARIQDDIRQLDAGSLENLPIGLDGTSYQWVDLDGEGVTGILTEQANAWFYKPNLGEGSFGPLEAVAAKPSLAALSSGRQQLLDLTGDGRLDLVEFSGPTPGFFERTHDQCWEPFTPFTSLPSISWGDPNLRFVDLNGDGHADVLITENDIFTWYPSLAEEGFSSGQYVRKPLDEETGPRLVFADGTQSIYLADMSGDGLTDLVRIRNGEVCYWPNLGYGRFGAKVTMDNAPWFDFPNLFDERRIRLADIDGSGTNDMIYLGRDDVRLYFNQSGNRWSEPRHLSQFPRVDTLSSVMTADLLGNSTACLVWSSPLPGDTRQPLRYIDLMGGQKPHLLIKMVNNLGAETTVEYASSTRFYLKDRAAGKPWITKLPFPVHCVEKVTVHDKWRNTTFSTTYSYHHGYFDGPEREFRGFGRVEQIDVEDYGTFTAGNTSSPYITDDQTLYQPPVKTVTWYHTGAFLDRERILSHFKDEYFPNWFEAEKPGQQVLGTFQENALPEPDLDPLDLTANEWREALRACKGMLLRQEVYELDVDALADGTHKPTKLFSTAYHNCHIHRVQPQAANQYAVFHVTESEAITYHYELDLRLEQLTPDPRIAHTLNLSIDEYGNIQQSVAVVYPRLEKYVDATLKDGAQELIQQVQSELHLAYTETHYTNDVPNDPPTLPPDQQDLDNYRLRLPYEVLTYEVTGVKTQEADGQPPAVIADRYFTLDELRAYKLSVKYQTSGMAVEEIDYHVLPNRTLPQKRIVEHARSLFFDITLDKPLELGQLNALGLPYESYKLALSDDILNLVFKDKLTLPVKTVLSDKETSGYLSGGDLSTRFAGEEVSGQYWVCAGIAGFAPDAAQHFYLPERYTDPFGNVTTLEYHRPDFYYIQSSTDALGSRTEVTEFDFRVLAPHQLKDANDNLSEVRFDILGMPTAMAVMGKGAEADSLSAFDDSLLNPDLDTSQEFFVNKDYSVADAKDLLRGASARHVYYFGEIIKDGKTVWGEHHACACGIVRERHNADDPNSPVQCAFEYSDGTGNVLVKKVQAEPEQPGGPLRWVASGKTILNNKGKPVKQYEPYFSPPEVGHRFEDPAEVGVTPVIYYDAAGRVIRTESPDSSYSYVEFSPWQILTFDRNDIVKESKWYTDRNPPDPDQPLPRDPVTGEFLVTPDQRSAWLAAQHDNTPSLSILDSLGREVVAIAHNRMGAPNARVDEKYVTFTKLDAEGKSLWVQDPRRNRVIQYIMPPLLEGIHPFDDANNLNLQGFVPCYDIAGNLLFQHSMDAGERWMLNDAAGKPMFAWDSRYFITRMEYDTLHRPTGSFVTVIGASTLSGVLRNPVLPPEPEVQVEKLIYGEGQPNDKQRNLRGKPYEHSDTAGVFTNEAYDFNGNPLNTTRQLIVDYEAMPDWSQKPMLEAETFSSSIRYDALNRPIQLGAPHSDQPGARFNIIQPGYNEANLLETVDTWLSQDTEPASNDLLLVPETTSFHPVTYIDYDAKGQRIRITYGNGVITTYAYDPLTFRLMNLHTTRPAGLNGLASQLFQAPVVVQDIHYTYDPVGNITEIRDQALPTLFFDGQKIEPVSLYLYDAQYRLKEAKGREHAGQNTSHPQTDLTREDYRNYPFVIEPNANDAQAMRNYTELYEYDSAGNILKIDHQVGPAGSWMRHYEYEASNNRLRSTSLPGDAEEAPYSAKYDYDEHGNMKKMPHLDTMKWDFKDQLHSIENGTEKAYYVYDAAGQRVRKVMEKNNGAVIEERIYLGGYEIFRQRNGTGLKLERETLHIMDDKRRIALVETKTHENSILIATPEPVIRYQLDNHLGSACLELDETGGLISYEEYHPYGSTSYQAGTSVAEVSLKRYRYTGKERDQESGLYYHGARYYAPWLGKWVCCDPAGMADGLNVYLYVCDNPVNMKDPSGRQGARHNASKIAIGAAQTYVIALLTPISFELMVLNQIEETKDSVRRISAAYNRWGGGLKGSVAATLQAHLDQPTNPAKPFLDLLSAVTKTDEAWKQGDDLNFGRFLMSSIIQYGSLEFAVAGALAEVPPIDAGGGGSSGEPIPPPPPGEPILPETEAELTEFEATRSFLNDQGITDALDQEAIYEAGLRATALGTDTPGALAQFNKVIVKPYAEGLELEDMGHRLGNLDTRIAIIMRGAIAERLGFTINFEVKVPGGPIEVPGDPIARERWLDLAIYQNKQLVRGVQGVKEINLAVPDVINPREAGLATQIQARMNVMIEELITGLQRPPVP